MDVKINKVSNPRFANAEKTAIDVDVDFDHLDEPTVPFTAVPDDYEAHGREIFERAMKGEFGKIADYVAPVFPPKPPSLLDRLAKLEEALVAAKIPIPK